MLDIWEPIDVDDALELIGKSFANPQVRQYAVTRLKTVGEYTYTCLTVPYAIYIYIFMDVMYAYLDAYVYIYI